jgi:polar amino acid transport system substrate-binding protein
MMKKCGLILSIWTLICSVQVFGKTLTICIEPKDVYPLYRGQGQEKKKFPGLYLEMISILQKKMGVEVKMRRQPFKRCLRSLKLGRVDAVASASYKDYRKEFGNYPFVKGKIHKEWRISASS